MNRTSIVAVGALVVAFFSVFTALYAVFAPKVDTPEARGAEARARMAEHEQRLLVHMTLFQRYAEKSRLAADADNWPLAAFYSEKIAQNAEWVVDGGYALDSLDISAIAAEVAVPRAERLADAARSGDAARFDSAYALMIDGCNACHKRSGYRYVQIQTPTGDAPYPSQSFVPIPGLRPE